MSVRRIAVLLVSLAVVACLAGSEAWACPSCKAALSADDPQPAAYQTSILFMLGMISSVMVAMTGLLAWVNRLERQSLEEAGYQHLFENGVTAATQPGATH